jgi:hypothetical protein
VGGRVRLKIPTQECCFDKYGSDAINDCNN